jgi:hypothetical protein
VDDASSWLPEANAVFIGNRRKYQQESIFASKTNVGKHVDTARYTSG